MLARHAFPIFILTFLTAISVALVAAESDVALQRDFQNPTLAARPKIWWFWGESLTTDHGITRDLEAMKRAGLGGVVLYEQVFSDPPDALKSLSQDWLARFRFAASECARLGMTLDVNVSGGFVAGGPWITPELGMQRLVASEVVVEGGRRLHLNVPAPAARLGYYRDVALLAYPTPASGDLSERLEPKITSEPSAVDVKTLFDVSRSTRVRISAPSDAGPVVIQLDYGAPFTARSLTYQQRPNSKALVIATQIATSWADDFYGENMRLNPAIGWLEASVDGREWRQICELPAVGYQHDSWTQRTLAFSATTARYFRLRLQGWGRNARAGDDDLLLAGVELRGEARIDRWEPKSGNVADFSDADRTPQYGPGEVIDPAAVLDISNCLDAHGTLAWDAPPGRWTILRLGHTPTGVRTKHARPESTGLECDKLSAAAARVQFENYVGLLLREMKKVPGARIAGLSIDSNEHGSQNWTANFAAEFRKRRGYDIVPYLPAMVGRVVGTRDTSDRFLYDVRRTIADLMSDEYFGTFQQLCHDAGMSLTAQAPGIATCLPTDNLQSKGRTDIPMGEFWMTQRDGTMDCKEASSAAHTYGMPIAAAEAFTGSRADAHPGMMKPLADAALALGINQFVVLAYVHQPWDDRKPGVTEPRFYLPYQRHNTWWEDSLGFWTTLTRSVFMMRQGTSVSDLLYHLGGDTPLKIATWRMRPAPPDGYDYDVCNDEILLTRVSVRDGRIVLPDKTSYRLLVLAGGDRMTLAAARRLRELVRAGALVLGPLKPIGSPSLADGGPGDEEVRRIADELWGDVSALGEKHSGAGKVVWRGSPEEVLKAHGVPAAVEFRPAGHRLDVLHAQRATGSCDIFFVANHLPSPIRKEAVFRARQVAPQLWNPETGKMSAPTDWQRMEDGRTEVTLALEPHESVFVVFVDDDASPRMPAADRLLVGERQVLLALDGPWEVLFSTEWGGPGKVRFPTLSPWNESADDRVRDYSGAAVYQTSFEYSPGGGGGGVLLDLGAVHVLASVKLNGHDLGTAWKPPFAFDASSAIRPGANYLEIRVLNTWVNRLIADSGLPVTRRLTWTTDNPYTPKDARMPSGLLGPVVLRANGRAP